MDALHIVGSVRVTAHRGAGDDLLTAGLGLAGLRGPAPPFADAARPTPDELRRRAIWSNWRGIADLSPRGGFGTVYGSTAAVPGREFHAFLRLPGARHPHRVAVQVPDAFDAARRCVIVAPASGSRGVYGAIAAAASWGLPRGCAIAYTDKGAGTDVFDLDTGQGIALDGSVQHAGRAVLGFEPDVQGHGVALKHAHSGDNPEADWGRHVRQAAAFALHALDEAFPAQAPFRFDNTTVIAAGLSNGAAAALRAAELDGGWLDAVVAAAPNVCVPGAPPLYDIATEAALLMPGALAHLGILSMTDASREAIGDAGVLTDVGAPSRPRVAYETLRERGWTDEALRAGRLSVAFDLWKAIAATYASAYGRFDAQSHPSGFRFGALGAAGLRIASDVERAAWWCDGSGIAPGAGIELIPPADAALAGLGDLRALWTGEHPLSARVHAGIEATRAAPPPAGLPVIVLHGVDDGLVPMAFSSASYVGQAGRDVRFWQVEHAQHFDAFLGLPALGGAYVPLLPYLHRALDHVWAHLYECAPLPESMRIRGRARGADEPLDAKHLALP